MHRLTSSSFRRLFFTIRDCLFLLRLDPRQELFWDPLCRHSRRPYITAEHATPNILLLSQVADFGICKSACEWKFGLGITVSRWLRRDGAKVGGNFCKGLVEWKETEENRLTG